MPGISSAHLIDLLLKLYREGDRWFRSLSREDWRRQDINKIVTGCRVNKFAHADDLRKTLQQYSADKIPRPHKALLLEPWDKAADTLLLLEPVFQKSIDGKLSKVSLYLGAVSRAKDQHHFMGYRYEGPEGGQSHNFYHAQPIVGFDGVPTPYSLTWYPDKWPTHALHVENDCQLLLALMLAFQGMSKVQSHASTRSPTREHATAFVAQLAPK